MKDDEGYSCSLRDDGWRVVDRYSRVIATEASFGADYTAARRRAEELNEDTIRRRLQTK